MSGEVSDKTAFPRASSWRVGVMVDDWEALRKAVLAETEPRSIVEPNVSTVV